MHFVFRITIGNRIRRLHGTITGRVMVLRRLHEGYTKPCCLRKSAGRHLNSFVMSMRGKKSPLDPKVTRRTHEGHTGRQDGYTAASRWKRWTHEGNTVLPHRVIFGGIFDMPKKFPSLPKVLPMLEICSRHEHGGKRRPPECPGVNTVTAEFEKNQIRVAFGSQNRESVTLA